jgi:hypothetical protein
MRIVEGETLRNRITNDLHIVMKIDGTRVTLENEIGSVRISLKKKDLRLYYLKIDRGDPQWYV